MGHLLLEKIYAILLDHFFVVLWIVMVVLLVLDFYARYIKVETDTDIDLVNRYMWLKRREK